MRSIGSGFTVGVPEMARFAPNSEVALEAARQRLEIASAALVDAREAFDSAVSAAASAPSDPDLSSSARSARHAIFDAEVDVAVAQAALKSADDAHQAYLIGKQAELKQTHARSFSQHCAALKRNYIHYVNKLNDIRDACMAARKAYLFCWEPLEKALALVPEDLRAHPDFLAYVPRFKIARGVPVSDPTGGVIAAIETGQIPEKVSDKDYLALVDAEVALFKRLTVGDEPESEEVNEPEEVDRELEEAGDGEGLIEELEND